jgi:hypothetical protein
MRKIINHYADNMVMNQVERAEIFGVRPFGWFTARDRFSGQCRAIVVLLSFYFALFYFTVMTGRNERALGTSYLWNAGRDGDRAQKKVSSSENPPEITDIMLTILRYKGISWSPLLYRKDIAKQYVDLCTIQGPANWWMICNRNPGYK